MKEKIVIQNVLKFKNDNGEGVRVGFYLMNDKAISNNKSFKGFSENACFYRDAKVFDLLPVEIIGKSVTCSFKSITNTRNPLKSISMIDSVDFNGNTIRLLQSEQE